MKLLRENNYGGRATQRLTDEFLTNLSPTFCDQFTFNIGVYLTILHVSYEILDNYSRYNDRYVRNGGPNKSRRGRY